MRKTPKRTFPYTPFLLLYKLLCTPSLLITNTYHFLCYINYYTPHPCLLQTHTIPFIIQTVIHLIHCILQIHTIPYVIQTTIHPFPCILQIHTIPYNIQTAIRLIPCILQIHSIPFIIQTVIHPTTRILQIHTIPFIIQTIIHPFPCILQIRTIPYTIQIAINPIPLHYKYIPFPMLYTIHHTHIHNIHTIIHHSLYHTNCYTPHPTHVTQTAIHRIPCASLALNLALQGTRETAVFEPLQHMQLDTLPDASKMILQKGCVARSVTERDLDIHGRRENSSFPYEGSSS